LTLKPDEPLANFAFNFNLRRFNKAIIAQEFVPFVQKFIRRQFPNGDVPDWVRDALQLASIDV
jgi:hypothetical protein